jgi:hypothetical protein
MRRNSSRITAIAADRLAVGGLTAIGTGLALALGRRAPAAEVRPHAGRAPATAN